MNHSSTSTFRRQLIDQGYPVKAQLILMIVLLAGLSQLVPIACSADENEQAEPRITQDDRDHWSFQPVIRPVVPRVHSDWVRNPIDSFVLHELSTLDLQPMPEAERATLIRRLTFDLTGLPPTIEEIDRFENDESPNAYEQLVERLLASPAFGERWAQHWLDLARFAETDGFEHDKLRPDAWKYRDWVIDSMNEDVPFDRFTLLQLAGDEISDKHRAATGFLTSGPDMPDINLQAERRHSYMNEMTSTVGAVFLGLQIGCAQCHDHKFDPISQLDFYRFRAFFDQAFDFTKNKVMPFPSGNRFSKTSHLMIRGDFRRPGANLKPAFLRIANLAKSRPDSNKTSMRQSLSSWLTDKRNPLTTRTLANRLWLYHFGQGLSETPSDFGTVGDFPFHVDLLNWLASEIPHQQWSLKQMHRLIVTSSTYRQISRLPDSASDDLRVAWKTALLKDPENRFWSRGRRRRLEGEAIRDTMLMVSNDLSQRRFGPGIRPPLPPELVKTLLKNQWPVSKDARDYSRRSVYLFVRRNLRYPLFEAFDKPDTNASCPQRNESTIAPQALMLLNSDLSLNAAKRLASSVKSEAGDDPKLQVQAIYRRCLGRRARSSELELGTRFIANGDGALQDFCLSVLNLNEFIYID
jgi:hypothetical protein